MTKKIDFNMNLLRSVAILMVILLHVNAESLVASFSQQNTPFFSVVSMHIYSVITRIAVPLFILISGRYILAAAGQVPLKEFYQKRIPRLLVPLVAWSFIYFFVSLAQAPDTTPGSYIKDFCSGFAHNNSAVHIWYLYMLIPLYLIAPFLARAIAYFSVERRIYFVVFLCVFGSVVEALKNITGINFWFLWWLEFAGLFSCGFVLKDKKIVNKKSLLLISAILLEVIAILSSIMLFQQGSQLAFVFHWGVVPHTQLVAVFVYLYFNSLNEQRGFLTQCSKYVLGIYLLHFMFVPVFGLPNYTGILLLDILLKTAAIYMISLFFIAVLSRITFLKKIMQ